MKTLFWIVTTGIFMFSCAGSHKMSHKNSSSSSPIISESGKVKQSYKSYRYHPSIKSHNKVSDVVTDKSLKNSSGIKKANQSSSTKYKSKQAQYLKNLNSGNNYKNGKKNDAIFILY